MKKIFTKNAEYQKFEVLKTNRNKRFKYGEFFVEGVRNINEAVKNGWHISSFLYAGDRKLSKWASDLLSSVRTKENYELTAALMADLSGKEDTSELLAVVGMREDDFSKVKLSANPILALFDRPSNKGNLGSVIRSCDAMGVDVMIIAGHAVDLYDPDVISSSMGSFFKVPVLRIADNSQADEIFRKMRESYAGFRIVGTTAHKQTILSDVDLTSPVAFLIGNETDGLSAYFESVADAMATIPMSHDSSASSINVSCAATVLFYEANRQRTK